MNADLFNDEGDEAKPSNEEPAVDPFSYALKLLLCQYPLAVIKDRLKEAHIRDGEKFIREAKRAISIGLKEDAKFAAEHYSSTLRMIIGNAMEAGQYAAAMAGMKELRDFMQLNPSANENKVALNVNFMNAHSSPTDNAVALNLKFKQESTENDNN